jgi:hypothetical protein
MKPFNLEQAKQGKPVVTRDGKDVRILTFDKKGKHCIVSLVDVGGYEDVHVSSASGEASPNFDSEYDLFMKSEKKEGWVNIYRGTIEDAHTAGAIYKTENNAFENGKDSVMYVTTIKVEWEE